MLPSGGSASQDTSECHSSPATCFEFSSAWIVRISGWPSGACGDAGWIANSPNSRPNALCWSWVSVWSRKKITRFSISASCTSWNCWLPSGCDRSTPEISAPICGVSFLTSIVWYTIAVPLRCGSRPLAERADDTGRIADCKTARRQVAGNDAAGADHNAVADRDPRQHDRPATDPDTVADADRARIFKPGGAARAIQRMRRRVELHRGRHLEIVADVD